MIYSSLIHRYLDEGLNTSEEDMLFKLLVDQDDARIDFNHQLQVHMTAKSDMSSITTPSEATNEVFARLGFSMPNLGAATDPVIVPVPTFSTAFLKTLSSFSKKHMMNFMIGISSALLTAAFFWYSQDSAGLMQQNSDSGKNRIATISSFEHDANKSSTGGSSNNASLADRKTHYYVSDDDNNSDNQAMTMQNNVQSSASNGTNHTINRNIQSRVRHSNQTDTYINGDQESYNDNLGNSILVYESEQTVTAADIEMRSIVSSPNSEYLSDQSPFGTFSLMPLVDNILSYVDYSPEKSTFAFGVKYLQTSSNPIVNVDANSSMFLNNFIFSARYKYTQHHSFGLELGWEEFAQKFETIKFGNNVLQEQQPRLFLIGASYRFTMWNLLDQNYALPYGQLFAGGTSLGPVAKTELGLRFNPYGALTFNLAYEFGMLFYKVNGNSYDTRKSGMTYSIHVHF